MRVQCLIHSYSGSKETQRLELGGPFKNTYELLNLRALQFSLVNKIHIFQCMGKIFCMEFQRYPLKFHTKYLTHWNSIQNIWPIYWKIWFLYNSDILRAPRFKSSYIFLKRSPEQLHRKQNSPGLTHWGWVTHISVSKLTIIGSDNGLSPGRRQAIFWTNAGILLIGPLGTNFNETSIEIHTFSFKKIHLKLSSGKWRPFCLGLNVLSHHWASWAFFCLFKGCSRCKGIIKHYKEGLLQGCSTFIASTLEILQFQNKPWGVWYPMRILTCRRKCISTRHQQAHR